MVALAGVVGFLATRARAATDRRNEDFVDGPIRARVVRIIAGDTIDVTARIWLELEISAAVRLAGVDAPEIAGARCAGERRLGEEARRFLVAELEGGDVVLTGLRRGKCAGRVVATASTAAGEDLGAALIAARLARPLWRPHELVSAD